MVQFTEKSNSFRAITFVLSWATLPNMIQTHRRGRENCCGFTSKRRSFQLENILRADNTLCQEQAPSGGQGHRLHAHPLLRGGPEPPRRPPSLPAPRPPSPPQACRPAPGGESSALARQPSSVDFPTVRGPGAQTHCLPRHPKVLAQKASTRDPAGEKGRKSFHLARRHGGPRERSAR